MQHGARLACEKYIEVSPFRNHAIAGVSMETIQPLYAAVVVGLSA